MRIPAQCLLMKLNWRYQVSFHINFREGMVMLWEQPSIRFKRIFVISNNCAYNFVKYFCLPQQVSCYFSFFSFLEHDDKKFESVTNVTLTYTAGSSMGLQWPHYWQTHPPPPAAPPSQIIWTIITVVPVIRIRRFHKVFLASRIRILP